MNTKKEIEKLENRIEWLEKIAEVQEELKSKTHSLNAWKFMGISTVNLSNEILKTSDKLSELITIYQNS